MANVKITDLTAYTNPVNTDVLPIVDVSNNVTKKVSVAVLLQNASAGTALLPGIAFDGDPDTGVYSVGANQIGFATNGTQRLVIDSTGQVESTGLGTAAAPSWSYVSDPNTGTFSPGADTWAVATGGSERFRCDTSGRLLVGTSTAYAVGGFIRAHYLLPDASSAGNCQVVVSSTGNSELYFTRTRSAYASSATTAVQNGDLLGSIGFFGANGTDFSNKGADIKCEVDGDPFTSGDTSDLPGRLVFSTTADGASSPTERMRVTSAGLVLIATQTITDGVLNLSGYTNGGKVGVVMQPTANDSTPFVFRNAAGTTVGTITATSSATAYNTSSDYRLKENVTVVTDGITRLKQLKPSRFNFIADPSKTVDGFLAHEVQDVVPEAITGEKDAVDEDGNPVYQGIDQSKLVPLLTAALQEAVARIEQLETTVATLQGS